MDLGGLATQGGASRLRRDALPWANLSLPLRGVRTIAPRGPGAYRAAMPRKGTQVSPGQSEAGQTRRVVNDEFVDDESEFELLIVGSGDRVTLRTISLATGLQGQYRMWLW